MESDRGQLQMVCALGNDQSRCAPPGGGPDLSAAPSIYRPGFEGNITRFILFRLFFNCRFYYPIYTLVFLDLGLTLGQFSLLNGLWALAIVLFEVPSGALADRFGRRIMVIAAATCMVLEMALLVFAPTGVGPLLFVFLCLNRVLSGMAEASASGADEALAYDSVLKESQKTTWPRVLAMLMRWQALGMIIAMLVGAATYDATFLNAMFSALGTEFSITREAAHRIPTSLTLLLGVGALITALGMRESHEASSGAQGGSVFAAFAGIMPVARWILGNRMAWTIIAGGMVLDAFVRLFLTFNGGYYRMLGLPEASFGLVACGMAALGLLTPALASWMQKHLSSGQNFLLLAAAVLVGWIGVAVVRTPWGIAPSLLLASCIGITGFLVSTGLNAAAHSEIRATVLSFRGLVFNLGYGALSAVFAWMQAALRGGTGDEMVALAAVLPWLPACFVCAVLVFCALIAVTRR